MAVGEEALRLIRLIDDGVDVVDLGDGLENLFVLVPVKPTLLFGLLYHLVVVLHQSPP